MLWQHTHTHRPTQTNTYAVHECICKCVIISITFKFNISWEVCMCLSVWGCVCLVLRTYSFLHVLLLFFICPFFAAVAAIPLWHQILHLCCAVIDSFLFIFSNSNLVIPSVICVVTVGTWIRNDCSYFSIYLMFYLITSFMGYSI